MRIEAELRCAPAVAAVLWAMLALGACAPAPSGPAAPNGTPPPRGGAAPTIEISTVYLGRLDRVADGFGLYSYLVITSDRLPEKQILAALCPVADLSEVEYRSAVAEKDLRTIHVMALPMKFAVDPRATVADLRRNYDFADAAALYRRVDAVIPGIGPRNGIFWIATDAGPLRPGRQPPADILVVRLDRMSPDLMFLWLADVRRKVTQGTDWRRSTLQQRLIAIARTLDLVADFSDEVLQFVTPALAKGEDDLPAPCRG